MAKKRKKRRPAARPAETTTKTADRAREAPAPAAAPPKRPHKEEARRAKELAYRSMRRRALIRRGLVWGGVAAAIAAAVVYFTSRAQESEELRGRAAQVAEAAGCSDIEPQPDQGRTHQDTGPITYQQEIPTSGTHRGAPLPPDEHVYETPADVTQAVHNLEHGYVVIWYRADGERALPTDVVDALAEFAEGTAKTILSPKPDLPEGTDLAFTAWNRLQECPSQNGEGQPLTPDQSVTLARAFSDTARTEAPEPRAI
jgi:hypothetical protein